MKIMYLLVPHLPVQVECQKRGLRQDDTSKGLVIGGRPWDASVVLDCCPVAEAAGARPGMPLARAVMRCPKADFVPADHTAYQEAQQTLFVALLQFTDRIETAGLGMFYVETGQLARRFPEDEELTGATVAALREAMPLDVQVGLAEERFTAEQAGLAARPNRAVVVPPRSGRSFLSSLPLTVLPATPEIIRRLDLLGIRTLGEMAALPRVALVHQFGPQAGFLRDLAAGADPRPVVPDAPPLELRHRTTLRPPTVDRQVLLMAAQRMATALAETLRRQSYQAQGLRIEIVDTAQVLHTTATAVEPPTADQGRLERRIQVLVERVRVERPVEGLEVILYPLRPTYLGVTQLALFSASQDQRWRSLQEALRRLRERFGELIVMVASLIRPPEPRLIEVRPGQDGAPDAFIWEGRTYRVRRIYEHWRERRFWWALPVERDYYRLEDHTGQVRLAYRDLRSATWWLDRRRLV